MLPSRSWLKPSFAVTLVMALTVWACGDSGGSTAPSSEKKPVASITISPLTAEIETGQTQQFAATLKDAGGSTLTGRTVTWSSSSPAIATVSSAGLANAAGAGEATITATSEGRSGTATLTVTQALPPGVVALETIGPAGGSIGTEDVGLSIAAGQLSAATQIQILSSDDPMEAFGPDLVTGQFRLQGFPQDREVEVRVRLRTTAPLREETFIGMGVPVIRSSLYSAGKQPGLVLREATDSAGYLVATLPVRGRGVNPGPGPIQVAAAEGADGLLDGQLGGVTGAKRDTVPGGRWVIVSWGAPRAELQPLVARATKLIEDAGGAVEGMNYSLNHRTLWPMEVQVHPIDSLSGAFAWEPPWPLDVNTARFELSTGAFGQPDMPAAVIHEFFHFAQAAFQENLDEEEWASYRWLDEAASTWIEERAPETVGAFDVGLVQQERNGLFVGLHPSLTANDGYGKASIMKYVADRWGDDQVKKIYENVNNGEEAVDAVLNAIPEAPAIWWPDLLTKYMTGEIYAVDPDSLPHRREETSVGAGFSSQTLPTSLRPLGAEFVRFTPTADGYGTGTSLTLRLPPALQTAGLQILPFRKDESGKWEEQGGVADSLVIMGADLNLGREYGIYLISTTASAPYTQSWSPIYETDLGYAEGEWRVGELEILEDAITYNRPSQDDTVTVDVALETQVIFMLLADGGVWKRNPENPNRYVWEPTAEFAADLAEAKATASSEAQLIPGDTLSLTAVFDLEPPASAVGESGHPAALGGACLLLIAGLAMRRRRQMVIVAFAGAFGLALWGCENGFISQSVKYRYEFKFTDPALTASLEDPTVPLVHLENGTGTVFLDRHRTDFWQYIRDAEDVITDSVAVARTASGHAKVKLETMLFTDGALDEDDVASMLRDAGVLRGPISALPEAVRARIWR